MAEGKAWKKVPREEDKRIKWWTMAVGEEEGARRCRKAVRKGRILRRIGKVKEEGGDGDHSTKTVKEKARKKLRRMNFEEWRECIRLRAVDGDI